MGKGAPRLKWEKCVFTLLLVQTGKYRLRASLARNVALSPCNCQNVANSSSVFVRFFRCPPFVRFLFGFCLQIFASKSPTAFSLGMFFVLKTRKNKGNCEKEIFVKICQKSTKIRRIHRIQVKFSPSVADKPADRQKITSSHSSRPLRSLVFWRQSLVYQSVEPALLQSIETPHLIKALAKLGKTFNPT